MVTKITGVPVEVEESTPKSREALIDFFTHYIPRAIDYPGPRLIDGLRPGVMYGHVTSDLLDVFRLHALPTDHATPWCALALYDGDPRLPQPAEVAEWIEAMESLDKDAAVQSFNSLKPVDREVFHEIIMLYEVKTGTDASRDRGDYMDRLTGRNWEDNLDPFNANPRPQNREWVCLWYDPDVSDCAIGCFYSTDAPELVVSRLKRTMTARMAVQKGAVFPLPIDLMSGWDCYC